MKKRSDLIGKRIFPALHYLFVPKCAACREPVDISEYRKYRPMCRICREKWEAEKSLPCPKCGRPAGVCICGVPVDKKRRIDGEVHIAPYNIPDGAARLVVLTAKLTNNRFIFSFLINELSQLTVDKFRINERTVLTYVPRDPVKRRAAGHDQSKIIARGISKKTGIPLVEFIRHKKGGKQQKTLDFTSRKRNARLSYSVVGKNKKYIRGREIILFDDTITTGSTMTTCAALLKQAGASKVYAISITKNCIE